MRLTRSSRLTKPALKSGRLNAGMFCSLTACYVDRPVACFACIYKVKPESYEGKSSELKSRICNRRQ